MSFCTAGRKPSPTNWIPPTINWWIGASQPRTENRRAYHLVFSNSSGGTKTKFVEADFTVSFE